MDMITPGVTVPVPRSGATGLLERVNPIAPGVQQCPSGGPFEHPPLGLPGRLAVGGSPEAHIEVRMAEREPNHQLISAMTRAGCSNKRLARLVCREAEKRGLTVKATHVYVQRWRDGVEARP